MWELYNLVFETSSFNLINCYSLKNCSNYFISDHVLIPLTEDIFKVIASTSPRCSESLESRLVPTLVSILDADGDKVTSALQSVALDILQTLVRANATVVQSGAENKGPSCNGSNQNPRPLSQLLVAQAFPAAVKCTLHSDDNSVTQVQCAQWSIFRIFY